MIPGTQEGLDSTVTNTVDAREGREYASMRLLYVGYIYDWVYTLLNIKLVIGNEVESTLRTVRTIINIAISRCMYFVCLFVCMVFNGTSA
jgi:heme/copper-type cytochrome/quinol oxidase subunit 4